MRGELKKIYEYKNVNLHDFDAEKWVKNAIVRLCLLNCRNFDQIFVFKWKLTHKVKNWQKYNLDSKNSVR
jgi:hypothetical protein